MCSKLSRDRCHTTDVNGDSVREVVFFCGGVQTKLTCTPPANMKVITAIYLNCRPELRDEWLASADVDQEIEDSLVGCV